MTIVEGRGSRLRTAMAKKAQTDTKMWEKWENGRAVPGNTRKLRIAKALGVGMEELWPDMYRVPVFKSTRHTHAVRPSGKPFCYSRAKVKDVAPGSWDKVTCVICYDKSCFYGGKENA